MVRAAEIEAAFNGSTLSTFSTLHRKRRFEGRSVGTVESVDVLKGRRRTLPEPTAMSGDQRHALAARILRTCAAAEGRALPIAAMARHLGAPAAHVREAAQRLALLNQLQIRDDGLIAPLKRPPRLRLACTAGRNLRLRAALVASS